jgi:hypothetical protein
MPLEHELHTFHEHKEHLLEQYKDRYVLIKGDDVVADFASRGDALREGYKHYGREAFLVKKVEEDNGFLAPLDAGMWFAIIPGV